MYSQEAFTFEERTEPVEGPYWPLLSVLADCHLHVEQGDATQGQHEEEWQEEGP